VINMRYQAISNLYPKNLKKDYIELVRYSNIKINPNRFIGFVLLFGFLLAILLAIYSGILFKWNIILSFLGSFIFLQGIVYFVLLLKSDSKAKFVENILPDVLQLMASNLRAGLTTDKALLLTARPEFGVFQDEINHVGKEITTGVTIDESLIRMSKRIKSERLQKTIALIVSGLRAGGELATLLEQTSKNLRKEMMVDEKIKANAMMYVIFIFVAICLGAPALFGMSSFLVEVLTKNFAAIDIPEGVGTNMPMSFSDVSISIDFVIMFSVIFLITSSFLGSLILGSISKGKEREGLKFMPALMGISLLVFFAARFMMKNMLGSLFGF